MKNKLYGLIIITLCLFLTGCGHVRSAKSLIKQAKLTHGKCEVVSKSETDEATTVVLRDKLQGFEYKITSSMNDINIDGASFGSVPGTYDDFEASLINYAINDSKASLDTICKKYGASYETFTGDVILNLLMPPSTSETDAVNITEEVATLMQAYNKDNRMDGFEINVSHDEEWLKHYYEKLLKENGGDRDDYVFSGAGGAELCHIGSARLPDCSFRDEEKENEDYYLEMAQMKYRDAKYVRKEVKTFADTGLTIDRVQNNDYSSGISIEKTSDPVTFYYYDANGTEFYICNFLDRETGTWYSNFDELNIKPVKEKKKLINIHFHFGDED